MTAGGNEAFASGHTEYVVHRVPQRVLPLLIGPKWLHRIGFGADAPRGGHFRSVDRVAIEEFGNALGGGQGTLGVGESRSE